MWPRAGGRARRLWRRRRRQRRAAGGAERDAGRRDPHAQRRRASAVDGRSVRDEGHAGRAPLVPRALGFHVSRLDRGPDRREPRLDGAARNAGRHDLHTGRRVGRQRGPDLRPARPFERRRVRQLLRGAGDRARAQRHVPDDLPRRESHLERRDVSEHLLRDRRSRDVDGRRSLETDRPGDHVARPQARRGAVEFAGRRRAERDRGRQLRLRVLYRLPEPAGRRRRPAGSDPGRARAGRAGRQSIGLDEVLQRRIRSAGGSLREQHADRRAADGLIAAGTAGRDQLQQLPARVSADVRLQRGLVLHDLDGPGPLVAGEAVLHGAVPEQPPADGARVRLVSDAVHARRDVRTKRRVRPATSTTRRARG